MSEKRRTGIARRPEIARAGGGNALAAVGDSEMTDGNSGPPRDARRAKDLVSSFPAGPAGLDPRTRLLLILVTSTVCLASRGEVTVLVLLVAAAALVSAAGFSAIAIRCVGAYIALNAVIAATGALHLPGLSAVLLVIGFTLLKFVPVVTLAWWFVSSVRTGELIASLERMRLPKAATVPLAVMVRYVPTLGHEYGCIRSTMRMRGIDASFAGIAAHPLQAIEHVLVPMLMRCLKVADELAASATSRGIENDVARTAVRDVRLRARDYATLAIFAAFVAGILALDSGPVGEIVVWRIAA